MPSSQEGPLAPYPPAAEAWQRIRQETRLRMDAEPVLTSFFHASVLTHSSLLDVLVDILTLKLDARATPSLMLRTVFEESLAEPSVEEAAAADLYAVLARDPACRYLSTPLLFYKGYQGLQAWRVANQQWLNDRHSLALYLQSRISEVFGMDIHPAARIGKGVMIDHASGVVIGETSVVEDDVSMYQGVTLGWNGKDKGDRHPKIGRGALLAAGAKVLGNTRVGEWARVAAAAVVLEDVPPGITVAGVPARQVGGENMTPWWLEERPLEEVVEAARNGVALDDGEG